MDRFKYLVDSPNSMESFRARYHIPPGVGLEYCPPNRILTDKRGGEVVIHDHFHRGRNDASHG